MNEAKLEQAIQLRSRIASIKSNLSTLERPDLHHLSISFVSCIASDVKREAYQKIFSVSGENMPDLNLLAYIDAEKQMLKNQLDDLERQFKEL